MHYQYWLSLAAYSRSMGAQWQGHANMCELAALEFWWKVNG